MEFQKQGPSLRGLHWLPQTSRALVTHISVCPQRCPWGLQRRGPGSFPVTILGNGSVFLLICQSHLPRSAKLIWVLGGAGALGCFWLAVCCLGGVRKAYPRGRAACTWRKGLLRPQVRAPCQTRGEAAAISWLPHKCKLLAWPKERPRQKKTASSVSVFCPICTMITGGR